MQKKSDAKRADTLHFEGMAHAPENELGVVFLFGKLHKGLGFPAIDEVKPGFPDCWARRRTAKGTVSTWIEFEFKSSGFKTHVKLGQHRKVTPRRGYVVCWEHNWPECEKYAEVIELRAVLGASKRVWMQASNPEWHEHMDRVPLNKSKLWHWTVAPGAKPGDLVLLWRSGQMAEAKKFEAPLNRLRTFSNIAVIAGPLQSPGKKGLRRAMVTRIANLKYPLTWEAIKADRVLKDAPFVRAQMFGQWDITAYWWRLHALLLDLNPDLAKNARFKRFHPQRF